MGLAAGIHRQLRLWYRRHFGVLVRGRVLQLVARIECLHARSGRQLRPTSGSSSATLCPPGTYSATSGAVVCTQAPAGSYDSGTGNTSASLCAVGYYSSSPGSSACTPAPAGSYVPTSGSSSATLCPPESTAQRAAQ